MRTTIIPAQITTVEDRIAGNLNLIQIILLMVPVFWTTIAYAVLPPRMHVSWYKLPAILIVLALCLILALRIKGKVVINWLGVLLKYNIRPRYFLFNKNDNYLRQMDLVVYKEKLTKNVNKSSEKKFANNTPSPHGLNELLGLENLIKNPKYTFSLKPGKKGGVYVAFEQVQS